MIALVRVRFNNTPVEDVWTDQMMHNWMNPSIEYSLAHFWTRTSFFQADMRYFLLSVINMDDPRPNLPADTKVRDYLVDQTIKQITSQLSPDWNIFDRLLICYAQQTDQFGGSKHKVEIGDGDKYLPVAVIDNSSPFSNVCQEIGHTFDLAHETDGTSNEYMSPYSCMSSELYGGAQTSFERREVAGLPVGTAPLAPDITAVVTTDVERVIGPYITPVQFYLKKMGVFIDDGTVYQIPSTYASGPHSFRINALDIGIERWPSRIIVLAVLPAENGDTYFFELRRNVGYDAGLTLDGSDNAPVAVVIHAAHPSTGVVRYINRVALVAPPGDRDYHCFAGHFTIRLNNFKEDFSSCSVTVGGDNFWKYFGVNFETILTNKIAKGENEWNFTKVSPCFMFPESIYTYRYHFNSSEVVMVASSLGYEKPNYQWLLNDRLLDNADAQVTIVCKARIPLIGKLGELKDEEVTIQYKLKQNTLTLTFEEPFAGIYISAKVIVNESSTEVFQSIYPDRSVWTGISVTNVEIEFDQAYNDAQKACNKKIREIEDHYSISQSPVPQRNPGSDLGVSIINVINELVISNPAAANAAINEVARLKNISKLEVIRRLR